MELILMVALFAATALATAGIYVATTPGPREIEEALDER